DPSSYPVLPLSLDVSPGPRLRIGVSARFGDYQVDRDIESNMYRVVEVLSGQGHTVLPVELPFASRKVHETAFAHFGSILATAMEPAVKKAGRIADYTKHFLAEAR